LRELYSYVLFVLFYLEFWT